MPRKDYQDSYSKDDCTDPLTMTPVAVAIADAYHELRRAAASHQAMRLKADGKARRCRSDAQYVKWNTEGIKHKARKDQCDESQVHLAYALQALNPDWSVMDLYSSGPLKSRI